MPLYLWHARKKIPIFHIVQSEGERCKEAILFRAKTRADKKSRERSDRDVFSQKLFPGRSTEQLGPGAALPSVGDGLWGTATMNPWCFKGQQHAPTPDLEHTLDGTCVEGTGSLEVPCPRGARAWPGLCGGGCPAPLGDQAGTECNSVTVFKPH